MAKYIITEDSYIDNHFVEAGKEIDTDATPAPHWTPLDEDAKKAVAAYNLDQKQLAAQNAKRAAQVEAAQQVLVQAGVK